MMAEVVPREMMTMRAMSSGLGPVEGGGMTIFLNFGETRCGRKESLYSGVMRG